MAVRIEIFNYHGSQLLVMRKISHRSRDVKER